MVATQILRWKSRDCQSRIEKTYGLEKKAMNFLQTATKAKNDAEALIRNELNVLAAQKDALNNKIYQVELDLATTRQKTLEEKPLDQEQYNIKLDQYRTAHQKRSDLQKKIDSFKPLIAFNTLLNNIEIQTNSVISLIARIRQGLEKRSDDLDQNRETPKSVFKSLENSMELLMLKAFPNLIHTLLIFQKYNFNKFSQRQLKAEVPKIHKIINTFFNKSYRDLRDLRNNIYRITHARTNKIRRLPLP
jgi:hypothetical protein